jgi:ribosomal protein S18 acetylase RimI-like enzyme
VTVREATLEDLTWFPGFASVDHIAHCRAALDRSGVQLLVAVGPQDLPLGELLLHFPTADGALVDTVCVHGPVRGIGIGTILMMAAEAVAASSGRVRVGLGVEATNEGAIRLYERLGYRHVASKELADGGTIRIMEKAIGRAPALP